MKYRPKHRLLKGLAFLALLYLSFQGLLYLGAASIERQWGLTPLEDLAVGYNTRQWQRRAQTFAAGRRYDDRIVQIPFWGRDLYIPAHYFMDPIYRYPQTQKAFLLEFLWPGLEPRSRENEHEFTRGGYGRTVQVLGSSLLRAREDRRPLWLEIDLERRREDNHSIPAGTREGLVFEQGTVPEKYKQYRASQRPDNVYYYRTPEGTLETVISCSGDDPETGQPYYPSPGCRHYLVIWELGMGLKASYSRDYLPQWREIQAALIKRMHTIARPPAPVAFTAEGDPS